MITFLARGIAVFICVVIFPFSVASALEPGEGIVLDPATGNYMLTYSDELDDGSKVLTHGKFFPATKIVPIIASKFHLDEGAIAYSYSVRSGAQSRQLLHTIRFNLLNKIVGSQDLPTNMETTTQEQMSAVFMANSRALVTPSGWSGFISTNESGSRITWDPIQSGAGIRPGESQQKFGFTSQSLPGLGEAQFKGIRDGRNGFSGEGPDPSSEISKQIQALHQNDFVVRNAAVPTIAVSSPFDPAVTLERIQAHIHTWIAMQLLDSAFSAQLDRYFQSAISAYRLNQPKVGKQQIETMRALVKKEQPNLGNDEEHESDKNRGQDDGKKSALIDRLAASVLDFDLDYVTKRTGEDDGEHDSKNTAPDSPKRQHKR
jgi:hypothetical protein